MNDVTAAPLVDRPVYDPGIFTRVNSLDAAKRIILTPERNLTTDQRWEVETPHVCDLIRETAMLGENSIVVDYGCGVGRVAKELIRRHRCRVVGVDLSPNMRALAASYVQSDKFFAIAPDSFDLIKPQADLIIAVWVLQHVVAPATEIARMAAMLKVKHGRVFVINEGTGRFVPSNKGWVNDGQNVRKLLDDRFKLRTDGRLSESVVGPEQSERTFWAAYSSHR